MTYQQDPPYTVKVEFTEGCNLRCGMCGIQGIREKQGGPYKFMEPHTAEMVALKLSRTGWTSKVEFTLRGEPLMNPKAADFVDYFRLHNPKTHLMITTNGLPLLRKPGVHANLDNLFDAGLNILAMDCYEASKKAEAQVRTYDKVEISDYPGGRTPYKRVKAHEKYIIMMEDFEAAALSAGKMGTKKVNNHAGAGMPPLEEPLQKRCARPFREMIIRWDGRVALCCNSWRDEFQCGTVFDYDRLEDAWNNRRLLAARRKLYHADRSFMPCMHCNETTYRNGLLPDRMGKQELDLPSSIDDRHLREALKEGPATDPVLRPWEDWAKGENL